MRRLREADVIYVTGGNAYHLAHTIVTNHLADDLRELLASKIYVGAGAGSMIFVRRFTERRTGAFGTDDELYQHHAGQSVSPFDLFDWWLNPHVEHIADTAAALEHTGGAVNLLDDDSAVRVVDQHVDVVSAGTWTLVGTQNAEN